jgi:addiction module RelE/StbE family toxin
MPIRYTATALADVRSAFIYIARDSNERIAQKILERVRGAIQSLADFPQQGRVGRVTNTRELAISRTSFIVAYRVAKYEIQILALIHSARRWPEDFS